MKKITIIMLISFNLFAFIQNSMAKDNLDELADDYYVEDYYAYFGFGFPRLYYSGELAEFQKELKSQTNSDGYSMQLNLLGLYIP